MMTYTITDDNKIEIDFHGVKPSAAIRSKMKAVKIWWDPSRMILRHLHFLEGRVIYHIHSDF